MRKTERERAAIEVFRRAGGVLRTAEALRRGIHRRELYGLRDSGVLERLSRGVFRLADLPPLPQPDLATVATRVPKAVVAVISALHFHGLTLEIPHAVSIAIPRGTAPPQLDWPPLEVYRMSGDMYSTGIEEHQQDGITLRIYSPAKTVADCFKFRNRVGVDVAVDGLRTGLEDRQFTPAEVLRAAEMCRVDAIMRPYLEAMQ
jgi:predicted transcriptional regulator of viral defense system